MAGYGGKDSLYEVLEVNRSSSAADIERAYRRLRAQLDRDAAPPDRLALVREAHEVLSDPQRRAQYDASLRSDEFLRPEGRKLPSAVKWGPIGAAVAAAVVGLWFLLRPSADPERIPAEIVAAAVPSVGRVQVIDISGRAVPQGNAFAIDQGVMLTTCRGFRANTEVVVRFGARSAPAQVARSDPKRDICRLAVVGAGSWPLGLGSPGTKEGDTVYAVSTNGAADAVVTQMRVRALLPVDGGQALELSVPVPAADTGGPVLDTRGRVIGMVVAHPQFAGKSVAVPVQWIQAMRPGSR